MHSQYNLGQGEALGFSPNLKLSERQADETEAPARENLVRLVNEIGMDVASPEPLRNDEITEHMSDEESEEERSNPEDKNDFSSEKDSEPRSYVS